MKHKILKAMYDCTDKNKVLGKVVFDSGSLYATDKVVAVRYSEDWNVPFDMPAMAVPNSEISAHKAAEVLEIHSNGFSWNGEPVKLGEYVNYPSKAIDEIFSDLVREGDADNTILVDPKQLAKVLAVFKAADIDALIQNHEKCISLTGRKFNNGHCVVTLTALVMGKRQ